MKCTLFLAVIQSFTLRRSIAFTINSRSISSPPTSPSTTEGISNRRQWIAETSSITSVISSIILTNPKVAFAEIFTQVDSSIVPPCLCDPSVSTFKKNGRIIHILGTAHISSASADVAGQLVREIKPSAVFVELDAKRVARIVPKETKGINASSDDDTSPAAAVPTVRRVSMSSSPESTGVMNSSNLLSDDQVISNTHAQAPSSPMAIQSTTGMFNPFSNFREKLLNQASQLVGNSIKSLYQKLESEGFSAGEEFAVAVREGLKVNSKIVLGDQDVELTLRRLTEALAKTDFKKIAAADAEIEQKMKELLPDSGKSIDTTGSMTKDEFTYFIETVKAKENVRLLMANLEKAAPEIYNAMVRERDMYMADGLDSLNQFESIVAVMGIAHVDGVERNLKEKGWVEVKYKCNVVR